MCSRTPNYASSFSRWHHLHSLIRLLKPKFHYADFPQTSQWRVPQGSRRHPAWTTLWGSHREVSGFQTITTCGVGLKNSCSKSESSPFVSGKRRNRRHPQQDTWKSATSRTNQLGRHGFVADLLRMSGGSRHSGIRALFVFHSLLHWCCCIYLQVFSARS